MKVTIDPSSGFCFGVNRAIEIAEQELDSGGTLYCLGEIVHNGEEVARLEGLGLKTVAQEEFARLRDCTVLIRAHGEPPETYALARQNRIRLIDASCPIVLKLQQRVKQAHLAMKSTGGQVVLYGNKGHAEVLGLQGQTDYEAIVIGSVKELDQLDLKRPLTLFSQTTKDVMGFQTLVNKIDEQMAPNQENERPLFQWNDTICRKVSDRAAQLRIFASSHEVIVFVSGKKSSNGKVLFQVCKEVNPHTYFVSATGDLQGDWFLDCERVGVCGATSTPVWLMKDVAAEIEKFNQ